MESVPESLEEKLIFMGETVMVTVYLIPFVKDRSLYPTHNPPLYSEQQHCML